MTKSSRIMLEIGVFHSSDEQLPGPVIIAMATPRNPLAVLAQEKLVNGAIGVSGKVAIP